MAMATALRVDADEVRGAFFERGWTDGLPIVPPTEAVDAMIATSDLARDDVLGGRAATAMASRSSRQRSTR